LERVGSESMSSQNPRQAGISSETGAPKNSINSAAAEPAQAPRSGLRAGSLAADEPAEH
jgi:hypothetical protein